MKTFTNYAEKKAKQFLNLLQGYTKGIRIIAVLTMLLTLGIGQIWALDANNARIYFDNTNSKWTYVQLVGGHGSWSSGTALTKITNTNNLWTTAWSWGGYNYFMFIDAEGSWPGEGKEAWQRKGNFNYSATVTHNVGSNTYFYFPSYSTKGTGYTTSQQITDYSKLNYNQTVQQQLSTDGGTSYSASTISIATVKVSSFSLGSATATSATSNSKTIALGNSSATCSAARTATVTYEVSDVKTGYTFVGWYDGTTQKSTNEKFEAYQATDAKTITARFKENTYTVTIKNDGHGTTTPSGAQSNVGQVTGLSIEATPAANYDFVNWTITSGSGSFGSTTSASTTFKPTSDATIQANFRSTATHSLTVVAGAGIASVTGSKDPVTLNSTYSITATPETGYTFNTWTANPAANALFGSATTANTTVTVKNGSVTVTATATENMSTLTTSNKYDAGDPDYAVPNATVSKIGYETTATVTATAAGNGYTFTGWTLTNCTRTDGGAADATSITVRSNGDGKAATVVANYAEDLTSEWHLVGNGNIFPDGWNVNNNSMMKKISGKSTESIVALKVNVTTVQTYEFKIVDDNGSADDTWYGYSTGNTFLTWTATSTKNVYSGNNNANNLKFTPKVAGEYEFKVDYSGTDPAVTITYPTSYTVNYSRTPEAAADAPTTDPSITSGALVLSGTEVTFTAQDAKPGYAWKGWYDNSEGTGTALSTNKAYTRTINADTEIYAVYTEILSTITIVTNPAEGGSVTVDDKTFTPGNTVQVGVATTKKVTAVPNEGYGVATWGVSNREIVNASGGATVTLKSDGSGSTGTLTANFIGLEYTITFDKQEGTEGTDKATVRYMSNEYSVSPVEAPTRAGYTFGGYYTDGAGVQVVSAEGQWLANATDYTDADRKWLVKENTTLYAKWTAITYTVTLDQEGAAEKGDASVRADYDANMPELGKLPTAKIGYAFMGYFDQKDGLGTKYYNAEGTSECVWDKAEDATLYAYFKAAEITINLNAASFEPNSATPVIATATLTPKPVGTTSICWELLYDDDTPVAEHDPQPTGEPNQVQFNINDLATGTYQIKATLREGAGCTGTIISHATQVFTITSDHTITIRYVDENGQTIKASTTQSAHVSSLTEITAPEIIGYTFKEWEAGDGVSIKGATDGKKNTADIEYNAYYDGYLKAIYTKNSNIIYFYNTLGWENVYVYFYNDANGYNYWTDNFGTGAHQNKDFGAWDRKPFWEMEHGQMEQITGTNIWYFQMKNKRSKVAFATVNQTYKEGDNVSNTTAYFQDAEVVYRDDLDSEGRLPMFVPNPTISHDMTNTKSKYYNHGYWMNYPDNSGYKLHIYDDYGDDYAVKDITYPFGENTIFPLQIKVELNAENIREGAHKMWFRVQRNDNRNFGGHQQKLPAINSTTQNGFLTDVTDSDYKIQFITPIAGTYTFTLDYMYDSNAKDYQYHIDVQLPAEKGDYRILYRDAAEKTWSGNAKTSNWYHASRVIKKGTDTKDIISFFINKDVKSELYYQTVASIDDNTGNITWDNNKVQFNKIDWSQIDTSGVYNFVFVQDDKGISLENTIEPYTGNYYIRVDAVGGKWDNYKTHAENRMTYSAFSESTANSFGEQYSHYVTKYCEKETNIKFTIANDYSPCISDTLIKDIGSTINNLDQYGTLIKDNQNNDKYSANVRFMWNRKTNKISRAYIGRAVTNDFLVIKGNKQLQKSDGKTLKDTIVFFDTQNWIYEVKMKVQPTTRVKVYAAYPAGAGESGAQYFCGAYNTGSFTDDTDSKLALGGSLNDNNYYSIRVLYDFKTNRLMAAWMPNNNEIDTERSIESDVMIIRDHQDAAQCITFANDDSKLTNVKTVYGVMRFNRWILNNRGGEKDLDANSCGGADSYDEKTTNQNHPVLDPANQKSQYERALYFISFPFDVHLSDVFGFGTYGQHWIIEYYDGLKRAREGYWIDSDPNWKYVTNPTDFVLKAYEGYILCLNLGKMAYDNTDFWAHNISQVELFFPSTTTMEEIAKAEVTMPKLGEEYLCKINRGDETEGDRRVKDSYWRCIGVPSYANYSNVLKDEKGDPIKWQTNYKTFPFLYAWNMTDNTLTPQSTSSFPFKTMHAYLVQNGGEIHWSAVSATPDKPNAGIIAKVKETTRNYEWRITLTQGEKEQDQAFVRLSDDEQVTTEFDFNQDLSKEFNYGRSDIYTLIGYEKAAANSLPLSEQTTLIPLGLSIEYNGDYTIAMPDGTANIGVTLIDTESNTRTNLSAGMEYTLTLKKGDYNNRFFIEISPIQQTPTDIEYVENSHDDQARKVLIDNILYIVRDGQIFDARGARVK